MPEITLYGYELDENSYRARLLLSMLGLDWQTVAIDMFPGQEHGKPAMLALNPLGTLPVVKDGDLVVYGMAPVLLYLARAHDAAQQWLPHDPGAFADVVRWVGFGDTALGPAVAARLQALFDTPGDETTLRASARKAFRIMDDHMTIRHFDGLEWFCGSGPTLGDLMLFPSFALSRDFGIDHAEFPALRRWIRHFRSLKGFLTMPGIPDYH